MFKKIFGKKESANENTKQEILAVENIRLNQQAST